MNLVSILKGNYACQYQTQNSSSVLPFLRTQHYVNVCNSIKFILHKTSEHCDFVLISNLWDVFVN